MALPCHDDVSWLLAGDRVWLAYCTWTPLALLAMTVPSFHLRARREESALAASCGEEWDTCAARLPMFIPTWKIK